MQTWGSPEAAEERDHRNQSGTLDREHVTCKDPSREGEACHRAVELVPVWPAVRLDLRPGGACHQAGACGVVACRRLDLRRAASAVGVLRVAVPSGLGVISAGMRRKAPHLFPHRFACFS